MDSNQIMLLETIKTKIERMEKTQHVEVFKILKKYPSFVCSENKNGIFINLTCLEPEPLADLQKYIQYVEEQEQVLQQIEKQKDEYQRTFFESSSSS
jgi:hypothetical protein